MAKQIITVDEIMDLAFVFDERDPIDWGKVRDGKEHAMRMMAATVIEQFQDSGLDADEEKIVMIAAITRLTTENMLLYTELMELKK